MVKQKKKKRRKKRNKRKERNRTRLEPLKRPKDAAVCPPLQGLFSAVEQNNGLIREQTLRQACCRWHAPRSGPGGAALACSTLAPDERRYTLQIAHLFWPWRTLLSGLHKQLSGCFTLRIRMYCDSISAEKTALA